MRPPALFHYTSTFHLPNICLDEQIRTTESNFDLFTPNLGPNVVWALDTHWFPRRDLPHGLSPNKQTVRITFRTPYDAVRWRDWEWTARMDPQWRDAMVETGGGYEAAERWWVVPHPVPIEDWTGIDVRWDQEWTPLELHTFDGCPRFEEETRKTA